MDTHTETTGVDPEVLADLERVMQHLAAKTPVDPVLLKRVEERANRVIEELRQNQVQIDVLKLLREAREES